MYPLNPIVCFLLYFFGIVPHIAAQPLKRIALQRLHHHHTHHLHHQVQKNLEVAEIQKIVRELEKSDLISSWTDTHRDDMVQKASRITN